MKVLTYEVLAAIGDSDDPDWTEELFGRIYQVLKRIEEIHTPVKIWETDKSYTLLCRGCTLNSYPCETIKLLGVDWTGQV